MNKEGAPFLIYALPRSRTKWLSTFLSYKDWWCGHEHAIYLRSVDDVKAFFARPRIGSVETAAAQGHKIIDHHVPNLRKVVIKRPVKDVVSSLLNVNLGAEFKYDEEAAWKVMSQGDRALDRISAQPDVLTIQYHELTHTNVVCQLFEHCLPYAFDYSWFQQLSRSNIQVDVLSYIRYYHTNQAQVVAFKNAMKGELRSLAKQGLIKSDSRGQA